MSPFETAAEWWHAGATTAEFDPFEYAAEAWRRLAEAAELAVDAQYRAAEAELSPYLTTSAAWHLGVNARDLWRMPRRRAERLASEELRAWWRVHGRLTVTDLVHAMWRDELEAMRAA